MKKPKGLALLLGEPSDEADDMEDMDDEAMSDKAALAGDVMDAMRSKDKQAFADALEAFVGACGDDYDDDEEG